MNVFSFLLCTYLGVEFLGQRTEVHFPSFFFLDVKEFFKAAVLLHTLAVSVWESLVLHVLVLSALDIGGWPAALTYGGGFGIQ